MRNLPEVNTVTDAKFDRTDCIDLKHWQEKANSEDLYALYSGEVSNVTHYQFHDLLFNLHYKDKSARFFRREVLKNFRELINGTIVMEDIRAEAAIVDAEETHSKSAAMAMMAELKKAANKAP